MLFFAQREAQHRCLFFICHQLSGVGPFGCCCPSPRNLSRSSYVLSVRSSNALQLLRMNIIRVLEDSFGESPTPNPLIGAPCYQASWSQPGASNDLQELKVVKCFYQLFQWWHYVKLVTQNRMVGGDILNWITTQVKEIRSCEPPGSHGEAR